MNYQEIQDFTYIEFINYLKELHGEVTGDYFNTNFIANKEIKKANEGLFIHHIKEDTIANLSNPEVARLADFNFQKADNLVYCDFLEHLFAHILIAESNNNIKGLGFGGADIIIQLLDNYFNVGATNPNYPTVCYDIIADDYDTYIELKERYETISRQQSILFQHNETAFLMLENYLETDNRAVVIIGTGGGKTTTGLAYLRLHQYKGLVLCPNKTIVEGWSHYDEVDTMTHAYFRLHYKEIDYSKYQVIICDEAHHCSSTNVTGKALKELMDTTNLKFIGLTAEKDRNDGIKVANDLYHGNACEGLSVPEGLEKGIFHPFSYVGAYYNLDKEEVLKEYKGTISDQLYGELDLALNNTPILANILKDNMPEGKRKGIIFCSNIEAIDEAEQIMKAIYPDIEYRRIHSKMLQNAVDENRKWFQETDEGYLMAVDMITEGAHYRGINTLIMFRHTESPLVFHQQLGRVITLAKYDNPHAIVFDLVNNINTLLDESRESNPILPILKKKQQEQKEREVKKSEQIIIHDYTCTINEVFQKIEESFNDDWADWEIEILQKFYENKGAAYCLNQINQERFKRYGN